LPFQSFVWLILCFIAEAPNTARAALGEVSVTSSSSSIHEGFTKSLSVNCSFSNSPNSSDFGFINSMILSKTDSNSDTYSEIAIVTSLAPDYVVVKNSLKAADVTGHLSQAGRSEISYTWTYPSGDVSGSYLCTVHGMDRLGHPVTTSATTEIGERPVDFDMILEKMRQMEKAQDVLVGRLNETTAQLEKVKAEQNQTLAELHRVETYHSVTESKLNALTARLNNSMQAVSEAISTFRGHTYLLSRPTWQNAPVMGLQCQVFGGYLAGIDDQQEYDFVVKLIDANSVNDTLDVMIGGTESGHENNWVFAYSGKPVSFFKWVPGEPNNSGNTEHCIEIYSKSGEMNDDDCIYDTTQRFICEIPA